MRTIIVSLLAASALLDLAEANDVRELRAHQNKYQHNFSGISEKAK